MLVLIFNRQTNLTVVNSVAVNMWKLCVGSMCCFSYWFFVLILVSVLCVAFCVGSVFLWVRWGCIFMLDFTQFNQNIALRCRIRLWCRIRLRSYTEDVGSDFDLTLRMYDSISILHWGRRIRFPSDEHFLQKIGKIEITYRNWE